jgi:hypothetical protein
MKSYQYPALVRDHSKAKGLAKYVLLVLATYAGDNGECFPSHSVLARVTGLSLRTIVRAMKGIPANELQVIEKGKATGYPSRYRITLDWCHSVTSTTDRESPVLVTNTTSTGDRESPRTTQELPNEPKPRIRAPRSPSVGCSKPRKPPPAPDVPIPTELDTPAFRKAWAEWREYRGQIKKPLKPLSLRKQLEELASWRPERAIAAIEHSIARGYQGIFEPHSRNGQKPRPPRQSDKLKCDL